MFQSPAQQLVGAVLNGRWRLLRLLGEGGMGSVFEADSTRGEGRRAIKVLHQEFVREPSVLQRFLTEATATRSLTHPNVAQVLDASQAEDGTPYIVMELLVGTPLGRAMEKGRAIAPAHAAPIVWGILQALGAAHAQRIVHRDLKPDNIFLVADARGQYVPKVLDFGIAKVMDAAGGMGSKTRTGVLLGTPGYMSPEQIKNSKGVDPRSDLWSVGVIFYEMLTGSPPFPADNEYARLTAVLTEEMRPIERYGRELATWSTFFSRAISKDPAQRFQSADEMARAITALSAVAAPAKEWGTISLPSQMAPSVRDVPDHALMMQTAPQRQYPSTPPPAIVASQPPPPPAAATLQGASNPPTHVSVQKPAGTPTLNQGTALIEVIDAPPLRSPGVARWVVLVLSVLCLGVGFAAGFLVARG
ncbi:MAG TPA: serine/threonine-protein kinase [Byssovorax sp.]|jgi:serine/threonine-protein kinase